MLKLSSSKSGYLLQINFAYLFEKLQCQSCAVIRVGPFHRLQLSLVIAQDYFGEYPSADADAVRIIFCRGQHQFCVRPVTRVEIDQPTSARGAIHSFAGCGFSFEMGQEFRFLKLTKAEKLFEQRRSHLWAVIVREIEHIGRAFHIHLAQDFTHPTGCPRDKLPVG